MAKAPGVDIRALKKRLLERSRELEQLLAAGEAAPKATEIDQQSVGRLSRMDALQVQAMADEAARRRERERRRIEAALERIEEGAYGLCTSCGEEIALKRLENDPATPLCIDCAERASHHG